MKKYLLNLTITGCGEMVRKASGRLGTKLSLRPTSTVFAETHKL